MRKEEEGGMRLRSTQRGGKKQEKSSAENVKEKTRDDKDENRKGE